MCSNVIRCVETPFHVSSRRGGGGGGGGGVWFLSLDIFLMVYHSGLMFNKQVGFIFI